MKEPEVFDPREKLFSHFSQYIRLSPALTADLGSRVAIVHFRKGDTVHDTGRVCRESYFIQQGLLRTYYLKDGKEISEYFSAEEEWVNSPRSFMRQQPDIYSIDALEDTVAYRLKVADLGYLFDNYPEMERYARLSMGSLFGHLIERITSLRFTSATEKYEHFCQVYAGLHQRLPLSMVASYLGITQETLSRIRARR
ncbi:Crp/Fnr family transcriptional regulator [Hymenobacter sp. IS2118]|uniref:Crp/Fnr family transcriptional regulator n=1 Tax=Hymenobacter sp. IS2118 TaxID=1505605 RepID=UPI000B065290|nr:Crp/Fnr family transcriptional regulator [Hymenobacter sp. IS2118]